MSLKMTAAEWFMLSLTFLVVGAGCLPSAAYKAIGKFIERKFDKKKDDPDNQTGKDD
ncbi:hypothetical protein [Effusibacillus consociatus]|uniref:Phage protein n=1 Tax=Effusibacillus consociatus TaxID=1117041 RepID=A0ABV9Q7S2_9BACL